MIRKVMMGCLALALVGLASLCVGFLAFAWSVARVEPESPPRADAIVALTGGSHRLADAAGLLARGQAKRLLVTGVHPTASRQDVARQLGRAGTLVDCCIDLDYEALNTVGNAVETRKWVKRHGFQSIIVVTSTYHMPRTLMELRRQMPEVTLVPYPVVSGAVDVERWWEHPATMRLLIGEYAKYLYALVRPAPDGAAPAVERTATSAVTTGGRNQP